MWWIILVAFFIYVFYLSQKKDKSPQKTNFTYSSYPKLNPQKRLNEKQIDISDIKLSDEQQNLFDILENTNSHLFITGKAGTGKSVLLQYFRQNSSKRLIVVAPTGVAALNVGGQTIHSLFRIKPDFIAKDSLRIYPKTALILRNIDAVVIDEISMVRADLMDAIDYLLRQARSNNLPFGGVQMIMFGDLYQLPPVVNDPELHKYFADNNGGYYFFNADAWKNTKIKTYELLKIFRQQENVFKDILNSIRVGDINKEVLSKLNYRSKIEIPKEGIMTLVTTNELANEINNYHLNQLEGKMYEYRATIIGNLGSSSFPTEEVLRLKRGAQVMLLKNDNIGKRWVNGSLGYIGSLSENEIKVNIDGIVYSVPQVTWSKIRYYYNREKHKIEEEVVSSFTQFPLKLAWAITIHKSQGQTYASIAVDLGNGSFAHGQTYVALSRCKSLDTLYLKREIFREDIIVDPVIINFMKKNKIEVIVKSFDKPVPN